MHVANDILLINFVQNHLLFRLVRRQDFELQGSRFIFKQRALSRRSGAILIDPMIVSVGTLGRLE